MDEQDKMLGALHGESGKSHDKNLQLEKKRSTTPTSGKKRKNLRKTKEVFEMEHPKYMVEETIDEMAEIDY
jgi:hypothetical protein